MIFRISAPTRPIAKRSSKSFSECAGELPEQRFLIAGAMYPNPVFNRNDNVRLLEHVAPGEHSSFYCSSRLTLSIARASMARMGYSPSGRLFEAAACGTAILSDWWPGLESCFRQEILVGNCLADSVSALQLSPNNLVRLAKRARERVLDCHTADHRAAELLVLLNTRVGAEPEMSSIASAGER